MTILSHYNNNQEKIKDKYSLNFDFRDNQILIIIISKSIENIKYVFSISNSYSMLNNSFYKLSIDFKVFIIKDIFLYDFSNKNNLFYMSNIPDMIYFQEIIVDNYKLINFILILKTGLLRLRI